MHNMPETKTSLTLPAELWDRGLFRGSAIFAESPLPLQIAHIDAHWRRLHGMPSVSDESTQRLWHALFQLRNALEPWIQRLPPDDATRRWKTLSSRLQRVIRANAAGLSAQSITALLEGLAPLIPASGRPLLKQAAQNPGSQDASLRQLELVCLETWLTQRPRDWQRYLNRLYRLVDGALTANTTTDSPRLVPLLTWIQHILTQRHIRRATYVDVGCSFAGQTPGLAVAVNMLRPTELCTTFHGTDIIAPPRQMQRQMLHNPGIFLYQANPVLRPLCHGYDVIVLANVHRHLTAELQRQLLTHLGASLREGGLLFINWKFDAQRNLCLCLIRQEQALLLGEEANLI